MTDALRALPPEFLQPAELHAITGRQQPAAWRRWLDTVGVRYLLTPRGLPLVYRTDLRPRDDADGLNVEALHGTRRKTAQARKS